MIVLGLETATPYGGAALWRDGDALGASENDGEITHSIRLMPGIDSILKSAGLRLDDLDGIAISIGPGSFTGLRIGVSVGKALAHAAGKPIAAVSTLEALAMRFAQPGKVAAPMLDARRGEVFGALFRSTESAARLKRMTLDLAESPEAFADRMVESECLIGGTGLERYRDDFSERLGDRFHPVSEPLWRPNAAVVAALGALLIDAGETSDLLTLEPVYVRKPDARLPRPRQPLR